MEEQEEPDWTERLPLFVRIPLGLIGLASIAIGLATGVYWLVAASMSAGHGGDAIPNLQIASQMLLPITLITFGISGVLCKTINRLAVMVVLFTLLVAHLSVILTFKLARSPQPDAPMLPTTSRAIPSPSSLEPAAKPAVYAGTKLEVFS